MRDDHLQSAVERLDAALARIEAALARKATMADGQPVADHAALSALEQRHAALRQVISDSVRELDSLLAVAETHAQPGNVR